MKKLLKKNQTIVSALAVMLAVAGYLTYAGSTDMAGKNDDVESATYAKAQYEISQEDLMLENAGASGEEVNVAAEGEAGVVNDALTADNAGAENGALAADGTGTEGGELAADNTGAENGVPTDSKNTGTEGENSTVNQPTGEAETSGETVAMEQEDDSGDIASLDQDASDLDSVPGEAVLTSGVTVADFMAQTKLDREQVRGANKEALLDVINNEGATDEEVQGAIDTMVALTTKAEMENAAEMLLKSKGFEESLVSINGDKVEVVIGKSSLTDAELAQVEDIVKRKTETGIENIIISLMDISE